MRVANPSIAIAGASPSSRTVNVLIAVSVGVVIGLVYTLSPLTVWLAAIGAGIVWAAGRNLPPREAHWLRGLLVAALAVRAAMIAWLFLFGSADHIWFNTFFGDEQYLIVRSMRLRQLWLGGPMTVPALMDVFETYGQTSYLNVIAYVQLLVGPAPYGIHLLNSVFFVLGCLVLHRLMRRSFGRVAAMIALAGVLFFPSLLFWSASALKESLTFLVVTCVMAAAIGVARATWRWRVVSAVALVAGLAALSTFRAGAFEMATAGLVGAIVLRFLTRRPWRAAIVAIVVVAAALPAYRSPRVQARAMPFLQNAARIHLGHVFTRGHSYKLLDQRFYDTHRNPMLTWGEATRFVGRSVVSVALYPLPWDAQSWPELAYLPEQMAWYAILAAALIGFVAGLRHDALVTLLFAVYSAIALEVVALHTGNIGTLVRHRAFALPYLIALSAVGITAVIARVRR